MKLIKKHVEKLIVGFALLLMVPALIDGCANNSPQTVAFKTYSGTAVSVQTALGFWDTYLQSAYANADTNKVVQLHAQEKAVQSGYMKWQAAMALVADAGAVWSAATQGTNQTTMTTALSAFGQAVSNASATQADLENAITSFSGKSITTP